MKKRMWTDEETSLLRERYADSRTDHLADAMGRTVGQVYQAAAKRGLSKSTEYRSSINACRLRRGDAVGAEFRFRPGQAAWNKGRSGVNGESNTTFKRGHVSANSMPVGTLRETWEGYIEIKTAPGMRQWTPLHRWAWKLEHGAYPARGMALAFRDGDKKNCAIENLECITRADLMRRNSVHTLPKEIAELVQLRGAIHRQINRRLKP